MNKNTPLAKKLRKNMTDTEKFLWKHLRREQLSGYKFRKQAPIGRFIVDFVCLEKRLVIEIDGGQHATMREKDRKKDHWLKEEGYRVLRFWNNDVLQNINAVLEIILKDCQGHPPL